MTERLSNSVTYERFALICWFLIHSTVQKSSELMLPPFYGHCSLLLCSTHPQNSSRIEQRAFPSPPPWIFLLTVSMGSRPTWAGSAGRTRLLWIWLQLELRRRSWAEGTEAPRGHSRPPEHRSKSAGSPVVFHIFAPILASG